MDISTRDLTSELALYLQVFAGCLSGKALAGDTKSPSGLFCSLAAARTWKCFITGALAARNAYLSCSDAWNLASHPIRSFSGLLYGICCPSAFQSGLAGSELSYCGMALCITLCTLQAVWPAAQELGKQQIQLCWPYLFSLVFLYPPCFCLSGAGWKVLWKEADPQYIYTVLCEWRPEVGQYLWVPLWILMMSKVCLTDGIFVKCSWVCMWKAWLLSLLHVLLEWFSSQVMKSEWKCWQ